MARMSQHTRVSLRRPRQQFERQQTVSFGGCAKCFIILHIIFRSIIQSSYTTLPRPSIHIINYLEPRAMTFITYDPRHPKSCSNPVSASCSGSKRLLSHASLLHPLGYIGHALLDAIGDSL